MMVVSHPIPFQNEKRPICLLDGEFAIAHDEAAIYFDGAFAWNDTDMDFCMPVSTRKFGIRVAEGDVQPRHLFILQAVAYQPFVAGERADGKFARAVAVGRGEEVVAH